MVYLFSGNGRRQDYAKYAVAALSLLVCLIVCLYFWGASMNFPAEWGRPIGSRIDDWILWLTVNMAWLFDGIKTGIIKVLVFIADVLVWIPWPVTILAVSLAAWKISGRTMAIFTAAALVLLGLMGRLPGNTSSLWEGSMETLALIFVSVTISLVIGIPLGVLASRSSLVDSIMKPVLDGMQTMPSFVYLLPRNPVLSDWATCPPESLPPSSMHPRP